jgi:hypothetical protein
MPNLPKVSLEPLAVSEDADTSAFTDWLLGEKGANPLPINVVRQLMAILKSGQSGQLDQIAIRRFGLDSGSKRSWATSAKERQVIPERIRHLVNGPMRRQLSNWPAKLRTGQPLLEAVR